MNFGDLNSDFVAINAHLESLRVERAIMRAQLATVENQVGPLFSAISAFLAASRYEDMPPELEPLVVNLTQTFGQASAARALGWS